MSTHEDSRVSEMAASVRSLLQQAAALLLYQSVLKGDAGQAFLALLRSLNQAATRISDPNLECLEAYGHWFHTLAAQQKSWQAYLLLRVLQDENPFTRQAQQYDLEALPKPLVEAARLDLCALQSLYRCSGKQLSHWVKLACQLPDLPVFWLQERLHDDQLSFALPTDAPWTDSLSLIAAQYRQYGVGVFAEFRALRWQGGQLVGIAHPDRIQVSDLVGYELQHEVLLQNTEALLGGYPALHVLLYGSRGSGKSSLVKALLNRYQERGLRLIEVAKSALGDLPMIVEQLRDRPQKFILFVDDLSFEEDDDAYKALKVVLEGNLTDRSQNVVVYATSNRRHLIREFFGDRPSPKDGDEIHAWDTVQEKLSFSDRFGLTLTFEPANQVTYLQMVHHLTTQAGVALSQEDLEFRALQWATRHNGRSGRTARQFVDFLQAELALAIADENH